MKKLISILLTITMLLGIASSLPLSASAATTDKVESGFTYVDSYGTWIYDVINDSTEARIRYYKGTETEIEIPKRIPHMQLDKKIYLPVVEIGNPIDTDDAGAPVFQQVYDTLTKVSIPDTVRVIGGGAACELVDVFLSTEFEGGRHQRRVDQIMAIEKGEIL